MAKLDFAAINQAALGCFERLLREWLPGGQKSGSEYSALNPTRADTKRGSFSINIHKGIWQDFATGDRGGDPVSLYAYLFTAGDQGLAGKALADVLGVAALSAPVVAEKKPRTEWRSMTPPIDAPEPPKAHIKRGFPDVVYRYASAEGHALGFVYRFTTSDGGKDTLPLSWARHSVTGAEEWRWMAFAEPRWLYGLDRLAANADAMVLVVEGEKCADAAQAVLSDWAVVSWPGGGKAVDKVDWQPLAGRKVVIWPDCDALCDKSGQLLPEDLQPGKLAALKIADKLQALGCPLWLMRLPEPGSVVSGFDVADWLIEAKPDATIDDLPELAIRLQDYIRDQCRRLAAADHGVGAGRPHWRDGLVGKPRGGLDECRENVFLILSRHPDWAGVIGFNEFTQRVEKRKPTPFGSEPGEWTTDDDYLVGLWLTQHCDLNIKSESYLVSGVAMVAHQQRFNPLLDWLDALPVWDGVPRLNCFIADCIGCANTEYVQKVGRYFMIGVIARALKPGCPMQYMPVLDGVQGLGKSTFWRTLGGEWYEESPFKFGDRDGYMNISGALIYEVAELDGFNKAETSAVKAFITQQRDRYREPYARRPVDRPRRCVFVGTVNHNEYLKDSTGNRRFWPLTVEDEVDIELLKAIRLQLFAEALAAFKAGERWYPTRDEESQWFAPEQEARLIVDGWLYPVKEWLNDVDQRMLREFTATQVATGACKIELSKVDRAQLTRVGNIMQQLGWRKARQASGHRHWVYVRPA